MSKDKLTVAGFSDGFGGFRVLDPECSMITRHKGGTADRGGHGMYTFDEFTNDEGISKSVTYSIIKVQCEMPDEMISISKRAHKIWKRLEWRKRRGTLFDRDWKKSQKDLEELKQLSVRSKELNDNTLKDVF